MGSANNFFVPAAILLDNPGINLDEYQQRLNQVAIGDISPNLPLRTSLISNEFHGGPIGLAKNIISLPFRNSQLDEHYKKDFLKLSGLKILPFFDGEWKNPSYRIVTYVGEKLAQPEQYKSWTSKRHKQGNYVSSSKLFPYQTNLIVQMNGEETIQTYPHSPRFYVEKEISTKLIKVKDQFPDIKVKNKDERVLVQDLVLRRSDPIYSIIEFPNYEELISAYPKYSLDALFDISIDRGELWTHHAYRPIYWYKKGNGFYLDTDSLLKNDQEEVYTSIVLTAEAIKHKEWETLDDCSGDERDGILSQFYMRHPDSVARHAHAVLNFWDARDAYINNRNISDWLRLRALEPWRTSLTREKIQEVCEIIAREAPENIRRMERRREYNRQSRIPQSLGKIPF